MRRPAATGLRAGLLLAALGLVAWASGRPFVFPSLGPTAFVLARAGRTERTRPRRVVGGHVVGALAGLFAWTLLAPPSSITASLAPFSLAGLRLAASASLSVALTGGGMLATDTVHPPACATTLIVSLGLLSTPAEVGLVVVSVVGLVAAHEGLRAVGSPGDDQ